MPGEIKMHDVIALLQDVRTKAFRKRSSTAFAPWADRDRRDDNHRLFDITRRTSTFLEFRKRGDEVERVGTTVLPSCGDLHPRIDRNRIPTRQSMNFRSGRRWIPVPNRVREGRLLPS
jgi:hypothetical protein